MILSLLQLHIQKFFPFLAHRQVWGVIFICAKITKVEKVIYCELGTKVSSFVVSRMVVVVVVFVPQRWVWNSVGGNHHQPYFDSNNRSWWNKVV